MKLNLFTLTLIVITALQSKAADIDLETNVKVGVGLIEQKYHHTNNGSIEGSMFILEIGNTPFLAYQANDRFHYDIRGVLQYEDNSRQYDPVRYHKSQNGSLEVSIPIIKISEDEAVSLLLQAEKSYNAPQLTEFEHRESIGINYGNAIVVGGKIINLQASVAYMNSEHEDDDDANTDYHNGDEDRSRLNRAGTGHFELLSAEVYLSEKSKLKFATKNYQGNGGYDEGKSYRRKDYEISLSRLFNKTTICGIALSYTERDKEAKMFAPDDQLETLTAECKKRL